MLILPQLMTSNRRGQSQSALRAVQGRHEAIQKIERQMIELAQLFQDMEAAVIEQEPAVENIDTKAEDTVQNVGKGNEQLDQAVVKARSARKKKWICLGIVRKSYLTLLVSLVIMRETGLNMIGQYSFSSSSSLSSSLSWRSTTIRKIRVANAYA